MLAVASSIVFAYGPCVMASGGSSGQSASITPPPVVSPDFTLGQDQSKVGLTYLSMKGNGADFMGGAIDYAKRSVFAEKFAGSIQLGVMGVTGDVDAGYNDELTSVLGGLLFGATGEFLAHNGDLLSVLLFGGPNATFLFGNFETSSAYGDDSDTTMTGYLIGGLGGIQFGIKLGDFNISPYAYATYNTGSIYLFSDDSNDDQSIDPFLTTSFGFDITYVPWNLSLSAILQEMDKDDDSGMKTHIYQISKRF